MGTKWTSLSPRLLPGGGIGEILMALVDSWLRGPASSLPLPITDGLCHLHTLWGVMVYANCQGRGGWMASSCFLIEEAKRVGISTYPTIGDKEDGWHLSAFPLPPCGTERQEGWEPVLSYTKACLFAWILTSSIFSPCMFTNHKYCRIGILPTMPG